MMVRHYSFFVVAGVLPFVAAAAALLAGLDSVGPLQSVTASLVAYGLAIASFVAGTHWGIYLQFRASAPTNLYVSSNAAVLFPWLTFAFGSTDNTFVALVLTFIFLAFIDWSWLELFGLNSLYVSNLIESAYFRVRIVATALVCGALLLGLVAR